MLRGWIQSLSAFVYHKQHDRHHRGKNPWGRRAQGLTKTKPFQTLLKLHLDDLLNTCMANIQGMDVGLILWGVVT